jgi:ribosome-binding factor A
MKRFRVDKVASVIREVVSDAVANKLNDPRIAPLTSVTRVEVSGDLQIARVYVSVLGRDGQCRSTMAGLAHAAGRIQRLVAKRLTIRRCPAISFVLDQSLKQAAAMQRLIKENVPDPEDDTDADSADQGPAPDGLDDGAP